MRSLSYLLNRSELTGSRVVNVFSSVKVDRHRARHKATVQRSKEAGHVADAGVALRHCHLHHGTHQISNVLIVSRSDSESVWVWHMLEESG